MASEPEARAPAAEIRKATSHDRPAVSKTLARAFDDDPVMKWLFPWDTRRLEILEAFFDVSMRLYLRNDEVELYGDTLGAALWAPPGKWRVGPLDMVRSMPRLLPVMRSRAIRGMQSTVLGARRVLLLSFRRQRGNSPIGWINDQ